MNISKFNFNELLICYKNKYPIKVNHMRIKYILISDIHQKII
jgi:hypothetical protein